MLKIELTRFEVEDIITASGVIETQPGTEPDEDPIPCTCAEGCFWNWNEGEYGTYSGFGWGATWNTCTCDPDAEDCAHK